MSSKTQSIQDYGFTLSDQLLLDANIWLSLYGPKVASNSWEVKVYSEAFGKIINGKSTIYTDVLVVSEFINACARIEQKIRAPSIKNFKDFRKTQTFKSIADSIAADVKRILQHCSRVESGFETLPIDELIKEYATGKADFNDQVLTALCRQRGFMLVTHDGDFRGQGIPILTANKRLL